ncbi:MAG: right-handed parallel beta-helix repeat-containing protein, partial [Verrucomicrobiota bacterium]
MQTRRTATHSSNRRILNRLSSIVPLFLLVAIPHDALSDPLQLNDETPANAVELPPGSERTFYNDFTLRASNERYQQDLNTLIPLSLSPDQNRLLFTTLNFNYRDRGNDSFSGGIGYRFYLPGANAVMGFHLHGDVTETVAENSIGQFGFGFDFFTDTGIEFHANFYLPESERYVADPFAGFGNLYAEGNSLFQNTFAILERGRRGGDVKVAFDIPFLSNEIPTRGFVGAYHYNGIWSDDLTGAMAGISFEPFQGARFGAEYYGDDEFFGDHWVFVAGVSAPLEFENVLNPAEWGRSIGRAFQKNLCNDRENMREKLFERVDRRQWVLEEQSPGLASSTPLLVSDSIIFVNNGGTRNVPQARGRGNGTFENPADTIQRGVNIGANRFGNDGQMMIAGGRTYSTDLIRVRKRGLSIFGNRFDGFGGRTFRYGSRPVIDSGIFVEGVDNFLLANTTIINGFSFETGAQFGFMDGGSLDDEADTLLIEGVREIEIVGNTFRGPQEDGIDIEINRPGARTARSVIIEDNRFEDIGESSIEVDLGGSARSIAVIANNRIVRSGVVTAGDAIQFERIEDARATVFIVDNVIRGSGDDGILFSGEDNSRGTVYIEDNTIFDVDEDAIDLDLEENTNTTIFVRNNRVFRPGDEGIETNLDDNAIATVRVIDNLFEDSGGDGYFLDLDDDSRLVIRVHGNSFLGTSDDAFDIQVDDNSSFTGFYSENVARGVG